MPFTDKDLADLEKHLDDRYVRRTDCNQRQEEMYARVTNMQIDLAKIGTKLNLITGILAAIGGAFVTLVIKILFGG